MVGKWKYYTSLLLAVLLISCKERFEANLPVVRQGYLVVEGFINAQGPTQIKLSRTTPVDKKQAFTPELNAQVRVEGDDNSSFQLSASANGVYSSAALPINQSRKYRLRIRTRDTKEYLSEFVEVKITPPIDSLNWEQTNDGVQFYINTHDPQNKTIYYRWDHDETWEIQSAYHALYKLERVEPSTGERIIRPINASDPQIYNCWKYDTLKNILLGSSAKLDKDIIHQQPIHFIPRMDERLGIRYSIQIKQYALDKEGYLFYEQMKKNTEALGTIFDPQPSSLKSNIRCLTKPDETVIGYVGITTLEQVRIFISQSELTGRGFSVLDGCGSIVVPNSREELQKVGVPPNWPYDAESIDLSVNPPWVIAYFVSEQRCVDCRARGGINVRPGFW